MPELTVLLLARDEAPALKRLLCELPPVLDALTADREILVVDGGSRDGTPEAARAGGARVIVQERPGYGAAFMQGVAESRGEYILTLDADGSHPAGAIPGLWRRRKDCVVVAGSRYLPGSEDPRPWPRRLLSRVLNAAYARVLGIGGTDFSGGFRLYQAAALKAAAPRGQGFEIQAVALARLLMNGGSAQELPYRYIPRREGRSKASLLRFSWLFARTLLRLRRELGASATPRCPR